MEKIKRLSPWEIFDLWETDAGTMDFADTDYLDQLRFRVHLHDARTGFDHTSTAYIDGAFFFQMQRAEYRDWARKAVRDPQYAKSGLKSMPAIRDRLDMYEHPIRYVMEDLFYDMTASIESANAMEMLGKQAWMSFSDAIASHLDPDEDSIWAWVPDALIQHRDVPAVKNVERRFWQELTEYCEDGNLDDFLYGETESFAAAAGWKMRMYVVASLSEDEMENLCKSLKKIGRSPRGTDVQIVIQGVRFDDLGDVSSAWRSAQNDSDIFPGVGATPGMFEVISHG